VLNDLLVSSRIFANFFTSEILSKGCSSQETVGRLWKSLGEGEMSTGVRSLAYAPGQLSGRFLRPLVKTRAFGMTPDEWGPWIELRHSGKCAVS